MGEGILELLIFLIVAVVSLMGSVSKARKKTQQPILEDSDYLFEETEEPSDYEDEETFFEGQESMLSSESSPMSSPHPFPTSSLNDNDGVEQGIFAQNDDREDVFDPSLLIDDRDEIRKAILYQEILAPKFESSL